MTSLQTKTVPTSPKVLIVGNGAREHAMAWKLSQSRHQPTLFAAPGNPGMATFCTCLDLQVSDVDGIVSFAQREAIDLVVVGPELPLSLGLVDRCTEIGIRAFGPDKNAALLESSKAFAKDVMKQAQVPTAAFEVFEDAEKAKAFIRTCGAPIVIKADGLAAGKGVTVAMTLEAAYQAVDEALVDVRFGSAGRRVVVESYLEGPEVSLMFFVDNQTVVPMISARDHKRAFDNDEGPNTGGMGAFAPVAEFERNHIAQVVERTIVRPTLEELHKRGITYRGVLYAGLMMTQTGPQVIEFNARFGDPETEVVLPLLDSDLLDILWAVSGDTLGEVDVKWSTDKAICVVLASAGYPESPRTGDVIQLDAPADALVFHAGTKRVDGALLTAGGRVLTVVGRGDSFAAARSIAYSTCQTIYFDGKHARSDIARSADESLESGRPV